MAMQWQRSLFNFCWQIGKVPEDWRRDANVKIVKRGNTSKCANRKGITFLSVPAKAFCVVVLLWRMRDAVDQLFRVEQASFRSGKSSSEQTFALRNITEQNVEFRRPLSINSVAFKKAFDGLHRESLWHILHLHGVPSVFLTIHKDIYLFSSYYIKTETGRTDFLEIKTGVRQWSVLSLLLFLVALDYIMRKTGTWTGEGISWSNHNRLSDLDFADGIAQLEVNKTKLQLVISELHENARKIGL